MLNKLSYDPIILAFVVDVSLPLLGPVKKSLIEAVKKLESDDRGYIYHPLHLKVSLLPGLITGNICNYQPPETFNLKKALQQTVYLMGLEDQDSIKHIFVILDNYVVSQERQVYKAMEVDKLNDWNCCFHLYCLEGRYDRAIQKLCDRHSRTFYRHYDNPGTMGQDMIAIFKGDETPPNYRPLNTEELQPTAPSDESLEEE